jgi:hypothetical protein
MWKCGPWSECTYNDNPANIISNIFMFAGVQFRDCIDLEGCESNFTDNQTCRGNVSVDFRRTKICNIETLEAVNSETKVPVTLINAETWKNYERFDVSFIQSADIYCPTCFNAVLDNEEEGIDCGGFCRKCRPEGFKISLLWWIIIITLLWLLLLLLLLLLLRLRRKRREEERRRAEAAAKAGGIGSLLIKAEHAFEKGVKEDVKTLEYEGKKLLRAGRSVERGIVGGIKSAERGIVGGIKSAERGIIEDIKAGEDKILEGERKAVRTGKELVKEGKEAALDALSSLDPYSERMAKKEVKRWFESDRRRLKKK